MQQNENFFKCFLKAYIFAHCFGGGKGGCLHVNGAVVGPAWPLNIFLFQPFLENVFSLTRQALWLVLITLILALDIGWVFGLFYSVCMSHNSSTRCGSPIMDVSIREGLSCLLPWEERYVSLWRRVSFRIWILITPFVRLPFTGRACPWKE